MTDLQLFAACSSRQFLITSQSFLVVNCFAVYMSLRCTRYHISNLLVVSCFSLTHYRPAMPFGNRKNIFEDLFSSVLSQIKKYHPPRNLKFNYLGIFQSLKLRISVENIFPISLKRNFTPNTLGWYGFKSETFCQKNISTSQEMPTWFVHRAKPDRGSPFI